jgi:hypothetical protein
MRAKTTLLDLLLKPLWLLDDLVYLVFWKPIEIIMGGVEKVLGTENLGSSVVKFDNEPFESTWGNRTMDVSDKDWRASEW